MLLKLFSQVMPGVIRPLRVIWNQSISLIFLIFGVTALSNVWRGYSEMSQPNGSPARLVLSGIFASVMLFFALTSYLRARKIEKQS